MEKKYIPIVGMEIHVELKTKSKMFCGCKNDTFHAEKPNIYTCPVCLGMPGGLPVPNKTAIEWTVLLGLALGCEIQNISKFDRKNYFYPDLAKSYQISQYDQPFCKNGKITFSVQTPKGIEEKTVRIRRVHLEEDTGKLQHATVEGKKVTLIDFNRSGVPLVEIVTEPDIHSGDDAKAFLKKLHQIIRYLNISDADMEKGSMRLEPNISVLLTDKPPLFIEETDLPPYKVEVKNINSFTFVKKAIEYEAIRHEEILKTEHVPIQETRGWNENKNETFSQRRKENADDYRYFPDPDIPPIHFSEDFIQKIKSSLPELPDNKIARMVKDYNLPQPLAVQVSDSVAVSDYIEQVISQGISFKLEPKVIANWVINKKIDPGTVSPSELVKLIAIATQVEDVSAADLTEAIEKVIAEQTKAVSDYKAGKETVVMFLLGMVIKELKGKGDKGKILAKLKELLS